MQNEQRLIWVDMEMTGLDPDEDVVIEIASIVTNTDLEVLAEGPVIAIHQSDATLARMDEWNTRTHGESGLIDRVRASSFDEAAATELTLNFTRNGLSPIRHRCAVTPSAKIGDLWRGTCPSLRRFFTTEISMSRHLN